MIHQKVKAVKLRLLRIQSFQNLRSNLLELQMREFIFKINLIKKAIFRKIKSSSKNKLRSRQINKTY